MDNSFSDRYFFLFKVMPAAIGGYSGQEVVKWRGTDGVTLGCPWFSGEDFKTQGSGRAGGSGVQRSRIYVLWFFVQSFQEHSLWSFRGNTLIYLGVCYLFPLSTNKFDMDSYYAFTI